MLSNLGFQLPVVLVNQNTYRATIPRFQHFLHAERFKTENDQTMLLRFAALSGLIVF